MSRPVNSADLLRGAAVGVVAPPIGYLLLMNLPALLFVAALVLAALRRTPESMAERMLGWILLLPIGVTGLWAGTSHVFFAATAAAHIGWQTSPFQFEVGVANLGIGVSAIAATWLGRPAG